MSHTHTPGPWRYGRKVYEDDYDLEKVVKELPLDYKLYSFGDGVGIFGPDGEEVVGCDEYQVFSNPEDIALMVAAPDMYEVLEILERIIQLGNVSNDSDDALMEWFEAQGGLVEKVEKALKKARGCIE